MSSGIERVLSQFDVANACMLRGDCGPWKELMSHGDDVTLFGAYGGHVRGWSGVSARFDRTAATYGGGGSSTRENISTFVGADLACVVDVERHETSLDPTKDPVTFLYRTTHVLRRENGEWKVVLRHADPLVTFRGPDFAHVPAGDIVSQ